MVAPVVVVVLVVIVLAAVAGCEVAKRRRREREWGVQSAAALASRVDVQRLATVRRTEGELVAIKALRDYLPDCPLKRSRELVAEFTGVPAGTRPDV